MVLHHLDGLLRGSARASCDTLPARVRYVSHTTSPTSAEASVGPVPCSPQRITLRRIPLVDSRSHITAPPCPHAVLPLLHADTFRRSGRSRTEPHPPHEEGSGTWPAVFPLPLRRAAPFPLLQESRQCPRSTYHLRDPTEAESFQRRVICERRCLLATPKRLLPVSDALCSASGTHLRACRATRCFPEGIHQLSAETLPAVRGASAEAAVLQATPAAQRPKPPSHPHRPPTEVFAQLGCGSCSLRTEARSLREPDEQIEPVGAETPAGHAPKSTVHTIAGRSRTLVWASPDSGPIPPKRSGPSNSLESTDAQARRGKPLRAIDRCAG